MGACSTLFGQSDPKAAPSTHQVAEPPRRASSESEKGLEDCRKRVTDRLGVYRYRDEGYATNAGLPTAFIRGTITNRFDREERFEARCRYLTEAPTYVKFLPPDAEWRFANGRIEFEDGRTIDSLTRPTEECFRMRSQRLEFRADGTLNKAWHVPECQQPEADIALMRADYGQ